MPPEQRLCLWCEHLDWEEGFAYSDGTWQSGILRCQKEHWMRIGDDQLDYLSTPDLYSDFIHAKTCPDFKLKECLVKIVCKL